MGLAIARSLAEGMNGALWYEPRSGQGARFVLKLPACRTARPGRPQGGPVTRVLIIEDHRIVAQGLELGLRAEGFDTASTDGDPATLPAVLTATSLPMWCCSTSTWPTAAPGSA